MLPPHTPNTPHGYSLPNGKCCIHLNDTFHSYRISNIGYFYSYEGIRYLTYQVKHRLVHYMVLDGSSVDDWWLSHKRQLCTIAVVNPYWLFVDLGRICGVPTLVSRKHGHEGHGIGCISLVHLMAYWLEHSCSLNIKHVVTWIVYAL